MSTMFVLVALVCLLMTGVIGSSLVKTSYSLWLDRQGELAQKRAKAKFEVWFSGLQPHGI